MARRTVKEYVIALKQQIDGERVELSHLERALQNMESEVAAQRAKVDALEGVLVAMTPVKAIAPVKVKHERPVEAKP